MKLLTILIFVLTATAALSQEIKIRFPKGGVYNTATANFSPNGKYVVTAQMDNSYNLWEVSTGKYLGGSLYQNATPNGYVRSKFSPPTAENPEGGKYYFVIGDMYSASIFETKTNDVVSDIFVENVLISAEFSPDGKNLLTANWDGTAQIWDIQSGKLIRSFKKRFNLFNMLCHATYSSDGKNIVTSSYDKTARIYDVETGKLVKILKGHKKVVYEAKYSPVQENSSTSEYILTESGDISCIIWDAQSGKRLHRFIGHKNQIQKSCFSPNAHYFATASLDSTAIIWDIKKGVMLHHLKGHTGELYDVSFSSNGKIIATCSSDNSIILWDVKTGEIIRRLNGHKFTVLDLDFSPINAKDSIGSKYLVSASKDATAIVWDTESGAIVQHLKSKTNGVWSISPNIVNDSIQQFAFSANDSSYYFMDYTSGKIINHVKNPLGVTQIDFINNVIENKGFFVSNQISNELIKYSIHNDNNSIILKGHSGRINRFHNNGKQVITASSDSTAIIWEIESGKIIHKLKGHKDEVSDAIFSPDGKQIATASYDNQTLLWDAVTGEILRIFVLDEKSNERSVPVIVAFSNGGDTIAVGYSYGEIVLWNTLTGKQLQKFEGHYSGISELIFTKNGDNLLSASYDKEIILWDIKRDTILTQFSHSMDVNAAFFSPNEEFVFSAVNDGSINMWDAKSGKKLLSHYLFDSDPNKWVHLHSSGLFDASPEAMELMYWTKGLEIIEFSQLKDRYWLPGLWEKVMKGEPLPDTRNMQELKLQPEVELGEVKDGKIPVTLTKREGGYGKVSILINGKEIEADARGNNFDKTKETQTIWVDLKDHPNLQNGENTIAVKASSEDGFVVGRPIEKKVTMSFQTAKPHFYAVVVGTGKYMNSSINLKYPEKDAESMSTALRLGSEQFFGKENTHIYTLTTSSNERPTKEKIKSVFTEIGKTAKSSDVILVYLSGHGITWGGDQSDFYYVTTDATAANSEAYNDELLRKNHLISTAEFTEYLKVIPANKQVMIIDACSSGKAVENLMAARDIDVSQIKAIDRMKDRTGMFVISGSAADAVSYEASRYGQGLLTYSILQAMKGAALRDGQFFDVNTILNYSRENVPRLAAGIGGIQTPQLLIPKGGSFDIGQVDEESKKQIPLSNIKPVFVRTVLVDDNSDDDDLNLSKLLDEQLNETAMRGKDAQLVFLDTREFPDAYRLRGSYTQSNGTITLKLKIKGPKESEHLLTGDSKEIILEKIIEIVEGIE